MIWTSFLLCLCVTWSQGKTPEDADASSAAERLSDSDGRKIVQIGDNFFFRLTGQNGTFVQAFSEQGLNWEEANAECQKLGDSLSWLGMGNGNGVSGNLPSFSIRMSGKYYSEWTPEWTWRRQRALRITIQDINKITGAFEDTWGGKEIGTGRCLYVSESNRYIYACNGWCTCDTKFNAFICQLS